MAAWVSGPEITPPVTPVMGSVMAGLLIHRKQAAVAESRRQAVRYGPLGPRIWPTAHVTEDPGRRAGADKIRAPRNRDPREAQVGPLVALAWISLRSPYRGYLLIMTARAPGQAAF